MTTKCNHSHGPLSDFILLVTLVVGISLAGSTGCTENIRAKGFGGALTKQLPCDQKLGNITWKDGGDLWYSTRPMRKDEQPETTTFAEDSRWGLVEGKVTFIETRCP